MCVERWVGVQRQNRHLSHTARRLPDVQADICRRVGFVGMLRRKPERRWPGALQVATEEVCGEAAPQRPRMAVTRLFVMKRDDLGEGPARTGAHDHARLGTQSARETSKRVLQRCVSVKRLTPASDGLDQTRRVRQRESVHLCRGRFLQHNQLTLQAPGGKYSHAPTALPQTHPRTYPLPFSKVGLAPERVNIAGGSKKIQPPDSTLD